jgi:hypothetical protein
MKSITAIALLVMAIVIPVVAYSEDFGYINLRYSEGDVQIMPVDTRDWVPAAINTPLRAGDRIWVPEGARAELQLWNGTLVRLDRNTAMEIAELNKEVFQFFLDTGHAYLNVVEPQNPEECIVAPETPASSLRAYGRSRFRIDVADSGDSETSVFEGEIYVESPEGQNKAGAGDRIVQRHDGSYPEIADLNPVDRWEQWNRERDQALRVGQTVGGRYLPEELRGYAPDLDSNGTWVSTPDYGYIWLPSRVTAGDWAPYRDGRWVWMAGDYVWISYEPWGWVPYHYGRWVHISNRGWCWVPPRKGAAYWGPGYVAWVNTSTHVAWVPLAPGETYYGHRYYGPGSVDVSRANISGKVVSGGYRNVQVMNAVTVMGRAGFIEGRQEHLRGGPNPFAGNPRPTAAPRFAPARGALMPAIKEIPVTRVPPPRIKADFDRARRDHNVSRLNVDMRDEKRPPDQTRPSQPLPGNLPGRGFDRDAGRAAPTPSVQPPPRQGQDRAVGGVPGDTRGRPGTPVQQPQQPSTRPPARTGTPPERPATVMPPAGQAPGNSPVVAPETRGRVRPPGEQVPGGGPTASPRTTGVTPKRPEAGSAQSLQPAQPTTMGQPATKAGRERPETVRPAPGAGQTSVPQPVPGSNIGRGGPAGQVRAEPGVERPARRIPAPTVVAPAPPQASSPAPPAAVRNAPSPAPKGAGPAAVKPVVPTAPPPNVQAPGRPVPQVQSPPGGQAAVPQPAVQTGRGVAVPESGGQPPSGVVDQSPRGRRGQSAAPDGERGRESGR